MADDAKAQMGMYQRVVHFPPNPSGERGRGFQMAGVVDVEEDGGPKSRIAYGSGINVWTREVEDATQGFYYRGHQHPVTCARWAPYAPKDMGGGWIMTGDVGGNWRVWTCRADEPVTKGNAAEDFGFKCAKEVRDIAWQGDGKKCVIVGHGSEEVGKCASWDSGNQFGMFNNISSTLLTCDTTMERPYRCMVAGEAGLLYFYKSEGGIMTQQGSPVRLSRKFINCVRFHPSGEYAVAVGADGGKIHILDGRSGKELHTVKYKNKNSIYSVAWNPEGTMFAVCGANKKVAVFSCDLKFEIKKEKVKRKTITTVEFGDFSCEQVGEYVVGKGIDDQQNSVVWPKSDVIVSSSIFGDLTYMNPKCEFIKTVSGHDTTVDDMAVQPGADGVIYTVSAMKCVRYNLAEKTAVRYKGNHGIVGRATPAPYKFVGLSSDFETMVTVAINDTIAFTPVKATEIGETKPTGGATRWLCCGKTRPNLAIILGSKDGLQSFVNGQSACTLAVDYESSAADTFPDDSMIVVTAMKGADVFFVTYSIAEDGTLAEVSRTEPSTYISKKILSCKMNPTDTNEVCVVFGDDTQCFVYNLEKNKVLTNTSINAVGSAALRDVAWRPGSKGQLACVGGGSSIAIIRKNTTRDPKLARRADLSNLTAHYGTIVKVAWLTDELIAVADDVGAIAVWTSSNPLGPEE